MPKFGLTRLICPRSEQTLSVLKRRRSLNCQSFSSLEMATMTS